MSTSDQHKNPAPPAPSDKVLRDARHLLNIFTLAWKNYGLYPEDHESTINSMENLAAAFNTFFTEHSDLRLAVEKGRLLYTSKTVHIVSKEAPSEDISTLLYRDGIKWIEFQEGLPRAEVAAVFRIAHKYRLFAEETEGDIVTALMDEELEYIDFKAVDIYWQDLMLINFSQLPPPAPDPEEKAPDQSETDQPKKPVESGVEEAYARSIADPSISATQLELSDTDFQTLQQMVQEEEGWNITEDLYELLLIILKKQTEAEKITSVLGFISEVVIETIELEKYGLLLTLFDSLKNVSTETPTGQESKSPLIDRFFHDLSRPDIFRLIRHKLLQLQTSESKTLEALEQTLQYFTPEVIPFLMPVMTQNSSQEVQQLVSKVIVQLSRHDLGPLEKIAEQHSEEMGDRLLAILTHLEGDRVNKILYRICDHPSNKVRRNAITELVGRDPKYAPKLFSLIDDPAKEIRACILAAFSKHKSNVLEDLLLNYLQEMSAQKEIAHILACYRALGHCGSNKAVPFLSGILLSRGWNSVMGSGKPVFREGAAIALALLDTPEAKDILQKASKSKFKVVRNAFEKRKPLSTFSGENTND